MVTVDFTTIGLVILAVWASGFIGILVTKWVDLWKTREINQSIDKLWTHARQCGDDFATSQRRDREIEARLKRIEEKDV